MKFALPTLVAALGAGVVGAVITNLNWSFIWIVLAMVGVVGALGLAAVIVSMIWPEGRHEPVGHSVGF